MDKARERCSALSSRIRVVAPSERSIGRWTSVRMSRALPVLELPVARAISSPKRQIALPSIETEYPDIGASNPLGLRRSLSPAGLRSKVRARCVDVELTGRGGGQQLDPAAGQFLPNRNEKGRFALLSPSLIRVPVSLDVKPILAKVDAPAIGRVKLGYEASDQSCLLGWRGPRGPELSHHLVSVDYRIAHLNANCALFDLLFLQVRDHCVFADKSLVGWMLDIDDVVAEQISKCRGVPCFPGSPIAVDKCFRLLVRDAHDSSARPS